MSVSAAIHGAAFSALSPPVRARQHQRRSGLDDDRLRQLIDAVARKRDRNAYADLFRHFAPRLKAYGIRCGADPEAAEELAQEAMISLWRKADTFDANKASLSTWLFTIVRNKRIDAFRRENRPEIDPEDPWFSQDGQVDAEEIVSAGEYQAIIRNSIGELPPAQAEIIQKAFFEDKSHQVIADELSLPLGTVKSRIRLALERLRGSMAGVEH